MRLQKKNSDRESRLVLPQTELEFFIVYPKLLFMESPPVRVQSFPNRVPLAL